jgi:hypothetical protein
MLAEGARPIIHEAKRRRHAAAGEVLPATEDEGNGCGSGGGIPWQGGDSPWMARQPP